jgi:hypothetical protein
MPLCFKEPKGCPQTHRLEGILAHTGSEETTNQYPISDFPTPEPCDDAVLSSKPQSVVLHHDIQPTKKEANGWYTQGTVTTPATPALRRPRILALRPAWGCLARPCFFFFLKKTSQALVAHTCNPSYLGS